MKKTLTASGVNGVFTGEVEIIFNAESRTRNVHNRGTHDDETVKYYVHKINGSAGGKELPHFETEQEEKVIELSESMEKQVTHLLQYQADVVKKQPLVETLKSKGYQ